MKMMAVKMVNSRVKEVVVANQNPKIMERTAAKTLVAIKEQIQIPEITAQRGKLEQTNNKANTTNTVKTAGNTSGQNYQTQLQIMAYSCWLICSRFPYL
jgi:uncharacterized membrane protein